MFTETPTPYPCVNHSARTRPVTAIVIHDTASFNADGSLMWFHQSKGDQAVSCHVLIDRTGRIWRVVPDDRVAWHAGRSTLHGVEHVNRFSLGVELVDADDYNDPKPYTAEQLDACARWCAAKCREFAIPLNRIVGHDMIAPGRKVDPGKDFPWSQFLLDVAEYMLDL